MIAMLLPSNRMIRISMATHLSAFQIQFSVHDVEVLLLRFAVEHEMRGDIGYI